VAYKISTATNYKDQFEKALNFICNSKEGDDCWEPDVIIVCAGYDSLDSDELASVSLQAPDFGKMSTRLLQHVAASSTSSSSLAKQPPAIIFGLEGGYQLSPFAGGGNLPDAVIETIKPFLASTTKLD